MRMTGLTLAAWLFPLALPAAGFQALPLRTPEQQTVMNIFGNLAVADVIYDRCGKVMKPVPTDAQKKAVLDYAAMSEKAAAGALHEANPLDKPEALKNYLASYKQQAVAAADDAIDRNGCDDKRVQQEMEVLGHLQRQLSR